jgi:predicted nuclease of restriction endonuclease-like (RecB) superfamily
LKEDSRYSESDLESAIIDKLEHFMLELGKVFYLKADSVDLHLKEIAFLLTLFFTIDY